MKSAPPIHATIPGHAASAAAPGRTASGTALMKYRLPGGPPPPLQVNGSMSKQQQRGAGERQEREDAPDRRGARSNGARATIATTPGKKYGTKPKWRPTRKYLMFTASSATGSSRAQHLLRPRSRFVVMRNATLVPRRIGRVERKLA